MRQHYATSTTTRLSLSSQKMERISSFAANISTLVLCNLDTNLSSLTFPRLKYFSLITEAGFKGPRAPDVIGFIRGSPLLEVLNLDQASLSHDPGAHITPVTLQYLQSIQLGGRPSFLSLVAGTSPYIEVDLLPHLRLPAGHYDVCIKPVHATLPRNTNYLLTLIHAWERITGSREGFGGRTGPTYADFSITEGIDTLTGGLEVACQNGRRVEIVGLTKSFPASRAWVVPDWESMSTDTGGGPGGGGAGRSGIEAQLRRLGCYLDPLRRDPSPLAALKTLCLSGFGHTRNKGMYFQYLRECFRGMNQIREFQVKETNIWMIAHLLRPFEEGTGGVVLLFPLLTLLSFDGCTFVEPPISGLLETMKKRRAFGSVLKELLVDGEGVDLSELHDMR